VVDSDIVAVASTDIIRGGDGNADLDGCLVAQYCVACTGRLYGRYMEVEGEGGDNRGSRRLAMRARWYAIVAAPGGGEGGKECGVDDESAVVELSVRQHQNLV
jgi:hypothetical protein